MKYCINIRTVATDMTFWSCMIITANSLTSLPKPNLLSSSTCNVAYSQLIIVSLLYRMSIELIGSLS